MKKSAKPKQRGVGKTLRIYEYEGKKYSLLELSEMANISPPAMLYRLSHWTSIERCVNVKKRANKGRSPKYSFRGHKYTLKRLSELGGINPSTIASRIRLGWSVEDACTKTVDAFHNGHKAKSE
jgi:hypothetical protein